MRGKKGAIQQPETALPHLRSVGSEGDLFQKTLQRSEREEKILTLPEEDHMANMFGWISLMLPDKCQRIVQVVSLEEEGGAWVSYNLAQAVAVRLGRKVLLLRVGFNNPRRSVTSLKYIQEGNLLKRKGGVFDPGSYQTTTANMYAASLPIGPPGNASFEDINSTSILLSEIRQCFDLIIVQVPSLAVEPEGVDLVRYVDGVILVVEAEKTKRLAAQKCKEKILINGGVMLGVVFNKCRCYLPAFITRWLY